MHWFIFVCFDVWRLNIQHLFLHSLVLRFEMKEKKRTEMISRIIAYLGWSWSHSRFSFTLCSINLWTLWTSSNGCTINSWTISTKVFLLNDNEMNEKMNFSPWVFSESIRLKDVLTDDNYANEKMIEIIDQSSTDEKPSRLTRHTLKSSTPSPTKMIEFKDWRGKISHPNLPEYFSSIEFFINLFFFKSSLVFELSWDVIIQQRLFLLNVHVQLLVIYPNLVHIPVFFISIHTNILQ